MRNHLVVAAFPLLAVPWLLPASDAVLAGDTYISSSASTTNYGAAAALAVNSQSRALLQFDLSTLPAGTTAADVAKATLKLWVSKWSCPGCVGSFDVWRVTSAWDEATVTNQTAPAIGSAVVSAIPVGAVNIFVTVDVTLAVKEWLSGTPNDGLALVVNAAGTQVQFGSKEDTASSHPAELEIALTGPQGPPGPIGPQGATGPVGLLGVPGPQGNPGPAGATGAPGASGAAGPSGLQGPAGSAGPAGPTGAQGTTGAAGPVGSQGPTGSAGTPGATGVQGPAGPLGPVGLTGARGAPGAAGAPGATGAAGPTGAAGLAGAKGAIGVAGAPGATGAAGPTGHGGPGGAKGAPGAAGAPGSTGAAGPAGAAGPTGATAVTTTFVSPVMSSPGVPNTVASGTALLTTATTACGNSSSRYLLKIEPGTYDLGTSYLTLCPNVDIEGSGEDITRVASSGPYTFYAAPGGGSVGEVRLLTVANTAGSAYGNFGEGFYFESGVSWRLRHVTVSATASTHATGIDTRGTGGIMDHVTVNAGGFAVVAASGLAASGTVEVNGSSITVRGTSPAGGNIMGVFIRAGGQASLRDTTLKVIGPDGAAGISIGSGATVDVRGSRLYGPSPEVAGAATIYNSSLNGTAPNSTCHFTVGASGNVLNSACQ